MVYTILENSVWETTVCSSAESYQFPLSRANNNIYFNCENDNLQTFYVYVIIDTEHISVKKVIGSS